MPLGVKDAQKPLMLESRCLSSFIKMQWENCFSYYKSRRELLSPVVQSSRGTKSEWIRWPGHALHLPTERLPRYTLFFEARVDWKMGRGDQSITRKKDKKTLTSGPEHVGLVWLPSCRPPDRLSDGRRE